MKIWKVWYWTIAGLGIITQHSYATRYVDAQSQLAKPPYHFGWKFAASNIQDAVNVATNGETVIVAPGTYNWGESVISNTPLETATSNRVVITKDISLISASGPARTIIVGTGPVTNWAVRCLYMTTGIVAGFTLSNGFTRHDGDWRFDGSGGAVLNLGGVVSNCLITSSHAFYYGGGAASGTFEDCTFENNQSDFGGGGAFWASLQRCVLRGNYVETWGGGIYACQAFNSLFVSNVALFGGASFISSLANCTLTRNIAEFEGGGSYWDIVHNSIVYGNLALHAQDAYESEFSYSCTPLFDGGTGNINSNPRFRNSLGDFRLTPMSPCRNAGALEYVDSSTDLDGNPRVIEDHVDMGAYELDPSLLAPYVDITNAVPPPAANWIPYHQKDFWVEGTNWNVAGDMEWHLSIAASNWFAQKDRAFGALVTGVVEGLNLLTVDGTNLYDVWTNDMVWIYRQTSNEVAPCVDITNDYRALPIGTTAAVVGGTNLNIAAGLLSWQNDRAPGAFAFAASGPDGAFTTTVDNLLPGTNVITVAGTNQYGWPASDTCLIFVGWPLAFVDITNANATVGYGTTACALGGTNLNAVGQMWWTNLLTRASSSMPAASPWQIGVIALAVGPNQIVVAGRNMAGIVAADTVTVTRLPEPLPFIDITNAAADVIITNGFDEALLSLIGTNLHVAGEMAWQIDDLATNWFIPIPSVQDWAVTVPDVPHGLHSVTVFGTNVWGSWASDTVRFYRLTTNDILPYIDITNDTQYLPAGTTIAGIGGWYSNIIEVLWWSNDRGGAPLPIPIQDQHGWFTALIDNLRPGTNIITVEGFNLIEQRACDTNIIIVGWPLPVIDITNAPAIVPYHLDNAWLSGTNDNIAGAMGWCVNAGTTNWFARTGQGWMTNVTGLVHGTNLVTILGTNLWNFWTSNTVWIYRQTSNEVAPQLHVTNKYQRFLYGTTNAVVAGTNHNTVAIWVEGWSNSLTWSAGAFQAGIYDLHTGTNVIWINATNRYGHFTNDDAIVFVEPEPRPFIDITNTYDSVPFPVSRITLGVTNANVVRSMAFTNEATGEARTFPAAPSIVLADVLLNVGTNTMHVSGYNLYGMFGCDTITVVRLAPLAPLVDITDSCPRIVYEPVALINGTNGTETTLVYCSNALTHAVVQPFTWGNAIALDEGVQDIVVVGTNCVGIAASDTCRITYHIRRPQIQVWHDDVLLTNGAVVDFGLILTGTTKLAYGALKNVGDAPLTNDPAIFGAAFSISQAPGRIILPGDASAFILRFAPVLSGDYVGALCITNNDLPDNPFIVNLHGAAMATYNRIWYSLCRLNSGIRCEFHYNAAENPEPVMDDFRFSIGGELCLAGSRINDPTYWHYSRANKTYSYRNKVDGSGRVIITLDTRRQQGSLFVKKRLLPVSADAYLPVRLTIGALDVLEFPYFAGAGTGNREHTGTMGFQSNLFIVTAVQVRYHKKTAAPDDVLRLRGVCFTNMLAALGNQFPAVFTWRRFGQTGAAYRVTFTMKRAADNICYGTDAGANAWIDFAEGRWELEADALQLEQPVRNQSVVLETRLQLGADPVLLDETVHYRAQALNRKNCNIVY